MIDTIALICQVVLTYMDVTFSNSDRSGPCRKGYIYIPVACAVMLYLVYLVECWHSHAWLELRYKSDIASVYSTIKKMQHALPVIWWKATCYHYVRRTRQVTRYRNGDAYTSTQVHYERVNSNTAGAAFNFTRCGVKDISRPLSDLEKYPAIKIKISKGFSFANLDTEYEFEEQRSQFFQEYETKDDYMEGREGMDLINVDFKEYTIAFRDPNNLPWYVSHAVFWIASFILLSWPLRTIIEFKTAHLHYHIHKLFGSNYLDVDNYPGLISRVSTMNSSEFEMSIRNNNVMVPSYSEAMIADVNNQLQRRDYGTIKMCKFPRSLTNVTFARRTSSSFTPAVAMNRVKKFKSCNVFVKSESTHSSLNSGSLRHQIHHQLVRERGKIPGKRTSTSQYSISGLSMGNENVRFYNGSVSPPDEFTITASVPYNNSVASNTISENGSATALSSEVASAVMEERCSGSAFMLKPTCSRPRRLVKVVASSGSVQNKSKNVTGSNIHGELNVNHSPTEIGSSLEFLLSGLGHDLDTMTSTSSCLPESDANLILTTISGVTPSTPSSPPGYEDAIKMRQLASSLISSTEAHSLNHCSEIELTENSSTAQTRSTLSITGVRELPGGKRNTNLVLEGQPIDLEINQRQSEDPCQINYDVSSLESSRLQPLTRSEREKYSSSHLGKQRLTAPTFKELPKVCKISSVESQDSDIGCLHSTTNSYLGYLDNAQSKDGNVSNRISQDRSFGIGSISRLVSTVVVDDSVRTPSDVNPRILNRMTSSSSALTTAAALSETGDVPASMNGRMETSV